MPHRESEDVDGANSDVEFDLKQDATNKDYNQFLVRQRWSVSTMYWRKTMYGLTP